MKKLVFLVVLTMLAGFATNQTFAQKKGNEVVCYKSDMDCSECEKTIIEYLKFEKGVKDLKVDHVSNTIKVEYKAGKNDAKGLAKAIEKKGYSAKEISIEDYKKIIAIEKEHEHNNHVHKDRNENK